MNVFYNILVVAITGLSIVALIRGRRQRRDPRRTIFGTNPYTNLPTSYDPVEMEQEQEPHALVISHVPSQEAELPFSDQGGNTRSGVLPETGVHHSV